MKTSVISSIIIKVRVRARGRDLLPQAEATQGEALKTRKEIPSEQMLAGSLRGTSQLCHAETVFLRRQCRCFLVIPCQTTVVDTVNPLRCSPEVPALPNGASKNNCIMSFYSDARVMFENMSSHFVPADSHVPVILCTLILLEGRTRRGPLTVRGGGPLGLPEATNLSLRIKPGVKTLPGKV